MKKKSKNQIRIHRKRRIRAKISGTASVPRVCVFRSLKFFYAQAIDDQNGHTLAAIDSRKLKKAKSKVEAIREMGETFGKELLKKNIKQAVFDRSGYRYHGQVKSFAEGIRKSGLKI